VGLFLYFEFEFCVGEGSVEDDFGAEELLFERQGIVSFDLDDCPF
jgi:hypothetical protein